MSGISRKIRYPFAVIKQIALLPKHIHAINEINQRLDAVKKSEEDIKQTFSVSFEEQRKSIHSLDSRVVSIKELLKQQPNTKNSQNSGAAVNNTMADNHSLDHFYKDFEDKFRGSEETIKERVSEYLDLFKKLPKDIKNKDIIDVGCGRGEFLSFAKDHGFNAVGVDMNKSMVDRANKLGYKAVEDDAISYMSKQKVNSVAAVTGFHLVEHIPFESLVEFFEECYRAIAVGGFVLFETPNPENLRVGSLNFHMDPSHIKPIPPSLLAFTLESVGFHAEIIRSHPVRMKIKHADKEVEEIMNMVYGPQDYAVVARKI